MTGSRALSGVDDEPRSSGELLAGWRVAHLTTVDMSLELLLGAQLDAVIAAGGEAIGISAPGPFVDGLASRGIRHVTLEASTRGWDPVADLRAARQLWSVLRRERPIVLHTHNPKTGLYGRVVGRLAGVPIVVNTVHGLYAAPDDDLLKRLVVYVAEGLAARLSDAELVQNIEDVAVMRRWRLVARRKLTHLGNGVDLQRFRPGSMSPNERRGLRRTWGADDTTVVVGAIGRLVAEKGYHELFAAAGALGPGVRIVVVGGDDPEKLDALDTEALRRADDVGVVRLGHRTDVDRLLGAFDIFALASHREGQPRAAMEAAAAGLPIVATDIRGCRQVVDHDVTGLLVPVQDAAQLADAIVRLSGSPGLRQAMGVAGRRKAEREFDERLVVQRVLRCYTDVATRKAATPGRRRPA